jgi:hypothetical protein
MMNKVIKGGQNIADILKISPSDIPYLKDKHGLPVFKINGRGPWRSTLNKLIEWADRMAGGE